MSGSCEDCALCCKLVEVNELKKPRDRWCDHCTRSGCSIYESRPGACRGFQCLWLASHTTEDGAKLPIELRPNNCHAVMYPNPLDDRILIVHVDPNYPYAHLKGPLSRLLKNLVKQGELKIVVYLGGVLNELR